MAGYIPHDREPMTRQQKVVTTCAAIAGVFMIIGLFAAGKGAPPFLKAFDFGLAPLGLVEWFMAWTFIVRARANRPEERFSPRALRVSALIFFLLGVMLIAIGIYSHVHGAD